jgi:hypothetical protein
MTAEAFPSTEDFTALQVHTLVSVDKTVEPPVISDPVVIDPNGVRDILVLTQSDGHRGYGLFHHQDAAARASSAALESQVLGELDMAYAADDTLSITALQARLEEIRSGSDELTINHQ